MADNVKFSVIVPVYNVENYIEETIKSVIDDEYKDVELILVNDGSKDKSGVICRKLADIDERIVFIDKENGGVASARNVGIAHATGDYLMFLDSDDYYVPGTFAKINTIIGETNCDICQFGFSKFSPEKEWDIPVARVNQLIEEKDAKKIALMSLTSNYLDADIEGIVHSVLGRTVTNAAVRRKLVIDNNISFFDFWNHEDDWIFAILCYQKARRVFLLSDCLYRYRLVTSSLSNSRRYISDIYEKRKNCINWINSRLKELTDCDAKMVREFQGILQRRLLLYVLYNETAVKSRLGLYESIRYVKNSIKKEKQMGFCKEIWANCGTIEFLYFLLIRCNFVFIAYVMNKIFKKYR